MVSRTNYARQRGKTKHGPIIVITNYAVPPLCVCLLKIVSYRRRYKNVL